MFKLLLLAILLIVSCVVTRAQSVQFVQNFQGTNACGNKPITEIYSLAIGFTCAASLCVGSTSYGNSYSMKVGCTTGFPSGPSSDYLMIGTYSDLSCKSLTSATMIALNTCIPASQNETEYSSVYYTCSKMTKYSDANCKTAIESTAVYQSCFLGLKMTCNSAAVKGMTMVVFVILAFTMLFV